MSKRHVPEKRSGTRLTRKKKNQGLVFLYGARRLFESKKRVRMRTLFSRLDALAAEGGDGFPNLGARGRRVARIKRAACRACGRVCRRRGPGRARLAIPCRPCWRQRLACDSSACRQLRPESESRRRSCRLS